MKKSKAVFGFLLLALLFLLSCKEEKKEGKVIASAYDYKLYADDLQRVVPKDLKGKDSTVFVQNYINRWMQEKVLLYYSKQNLIEGKDDMEKQIEAYRNSLMIYNYQSRFVQQHLDTIVSDAEIEEYYRSHPDDFQLKNNIVKVMFIKLNKDSKNIKVARKLLKSDEKEDIEKLKDLAERYSVNYFLNDDVWILFDDLLKEVPIRTYNQENFLRNNRYFEVKDSAYTTLVRINGFKIKDGLSPLNFEYERIRMIILNKRKQMLIKKLERDILEKARKDGALRYYNN